VPFADADAVHVTVALLSPAVAFTLVGASGRPDGVAALEGSDVKLWPLW